MSSHKGITGNDLHAPATALIENNTGAVLTSGQWVFLGEKPDSNKVRQVTRLATANEREVGIVIDASINPGKISVVHRMGDVDNIDLSAFSVGDDLRLTGPTTYAVSTDNTHVIGRVVVAAVDGLLIVDTISLIAEGNTPGASTLNQLNDVTIVDLQEGDILVNDAGIFKNAQPAPDNEVVITGPDVVTGEVIITDNGIPHPFDSGHALYTKDGSTPNVGIPGIIAQRKNLVFNGPSVSNQTILINGVSTEVTEVSTTALLTSIDNTANSVTPFSSRSDNREVVEIFKKLVGTPNEITITDNGSISGGLLTYSAPELRSQMDSLVGSSGSIGNIQDVTVDPSTLRNGDILAYSINDTMWRNQDLPSIVPRRLEDLEDVQITDQLPNKIIISESRAASVDIETTDAATIFGVDVSDNLMVVAPVSDDGIDQIAFGISRNQAADSISYLVTDNQILVQLRFASLTTTRDQIYAAAATALQTNFSNGTNFNERTIDGITYIRNGQWTTPANPRFTPGTTAAGSLTYILLQTAGVTDTSEFIYTFRSGFGSISSRFDIANRNIGATTLTDIVAEIAAGLEANAAFDTNFISTSSEGTLTITAREPGAAGNAVLTGFMRENSPTNQDPSTIFSPAAADVTVTGGVDTDDSATILRWTDISHQHEITRPLPFEQATLHFKQGAFAWRDEDFDLGNMVNVNPNTEIFPQMLVRPQSQNIFNYTDARIQNLDVDNQTDRLKTGTMLQYTTGNADWAYIGLGDDGTLDANNQPNYTLTPADGQFMVYDFRGGFGPQWTARSAELNDLFEVNTENQSRGSVLVRGATEWSATDATPGELFIELGNLSETLERTVPLSNARFDSHYSFTPGNEFFQIERDGAYEIVLAFSKHLRQTAGTEPLDETLTFFVSRNDSVGVTTTRQYAPGSTSEGLTALREATIPAPGGVPGVFSANAGPTIIDLIAGDTIRVKIDFAFPGTDGLIMENGFFGRSWLKIKRVG